MGAEGLRVRNAGRNGGGKSGWNSQSPHLYSLSKAQKNIAKHMRITEHLQNPSAATAAYMHKNRHQHLQYAV